MEHDFDHHPLAPDLRQAQQYCVVERSMGWLQAEADSIQELVDSQREPSPFQSPAWLSGWWQSFAANYEPLLLVTYCDNALVALMPLMRRNGAWVRELQWLGAGRSDHAPLLIRDGHAHGAVLALVNYLEERVSRWDVLSLRTLRECDRDAFGGVLREIGAIVDEDVSPRLEICGSWEDYLSTKSRKHRGNLVRAIKRLEANGEVVVSCETRFSDALLREVSHVEANSWKRTGGSLRMGGDGYTFFASVLNSLSARNALEVWVLRHQGQMLAYLITFNFCNRIFYYNGAYREDAKERVSEIPVGTTLLSIAIRSAHERKLMCFDFLRGDEPYKDLWATAKPPLFHLVLPRKSVRGILVECLLVRSRWWVRRNAFAKWAWMRLVWLRERTMRSRAA